MTTISLQSHLMGALARRALLALVLAASFATAPANAEAAPPSPPAFEYVGEWGGLGQADGRFDDLYDIEVAPDGRLVTSDSGDTDRIQVFAPDGTHLKTFGGTGAGDGQLQQPQGVGVAPNGEIFVADSGNDRIQRYDASGDFISTFNVVGEPRDVAIDSELNVYIATGFAQIRKYDRDGVFLGNVGSGSGSAPDELSAPLALDTDSQGNLYVSDTGNSQIKKFESDGSFVAAWGSQGNSPGQFEAVGGIDLDPQGNVWAADFEKRVQAVSPSGEFYVAPVGAGSGPGQFDSLASVAVNETGDVYVASFESGRIMRFSTRDTDGDGIGDRSDSCPEQPGPANRGGCPETDTDTDGVADDVDNCPNEPGPASSNGCPERDSSAPETTIDEKPKRRTAKRRARFEFSASEQGATFECKVDAERAFKPCGSPFVKKMKRGKHTFAVRATDAAGNVDTTPAIARWRVRRR